MGTAARLDLLIRDAAVTWCHAFSPARIFGLPGLAEDEPFGPDWEQLPAPAAQALWHEGASAPELAACAKIWNSSAMPVALPELAPVTRIVAAGGAAIVAIARAFADNQQLSWLNQVLIIAGRPENRQLAGLAAIFAGSGAASQIATPPLDSGELKSFSFFRGGETTVSSDVSLNERVLVDRIVKGS